MLLFRPFLIIVRTDEEGLRKSDYFEKSDYYFEMTTWYVSPQSHFVLFTENSQLLLSVVITRLKEFH